MDKLFVVMIDTRLVGVYTAHRKAVQAVIMDNLPFGYIMSDYAYDFGVEFFTFMNDGAEKVYEIQEITPDERA